MFSFVHRRLVNRFSSLSQSIGSIVTTWSSNSVESNVFTETNNHVTNNGSTDVFNHSNNITNTSNATMTKLSSSGKMEISDNDEEVANNQHYGPTLIMDEFENDSQLQQVLQPHNYEMIDMDQGMNDICENDENVSNDVQKIIYLQLHIEVKVM